MMHRYLFWRLVNGHFLFGLLALLVVVGIVLLIVYLTSKKYKTPNQAQTTAAATAAASASQERFLAILNEQKTAGTMGAAEYEERRMVLDGGRADNHANEDIVALKERYARGELTTAAYVKARNKLLGIG